MKELSDLIEKLEGPAKTQQLTGCRVDITLTSDASACVARLLRVLGGEAPKFNDNQVDHIADLVLEHVGLLELVRLWVFVRLRRIGGKHG